MVYVDQEKHYQIFENLIHLSNWSSTDLEEFATPFREVRVVIPGLALVILKNWEREGYLNVFSTIFTNLEDKEAIFREMMDNWMVTNTTEGIMAVISGQLNLRVFADLLLHLLVNHH